MSVSKLSFVTRLGGWCSALVLGATLTACAHPVVVEPVVGVQARSGPVVVQYGYGIPPAPLWVQPPVVIQRPWVVQTPVYPVYPIYSQPRWYGGRGWEHGDRGEHRGWRDGRRDHDR